MHAALFIVWQLLAECDGVWRQQHDDDDDDISLMAYYYCLRRLRRLIVGFNVTRPNAIAFKTCT